MKLSHTTSSIISLLLLSTYSFAQSSTDNPAPIPVKHVFTCPITTQQGLTNPATGHSIAPGPTILFNVEIGPINSITCGYINPISDQTTSLTFTPDIPISKPTTIVYAIHPVDKNNWSANQSNGTYACNLSSKADCSFTLQAVQSK